MSTLCVTEAPITLGIDPSMRKAGLVVLGPDGQVMFQEGYPIPQGSEGHGRRLHCLAARIGEVIARWQVALVGVEIADTVGMQRGEVATTRTAYWVGAGAGVAILGAYDAEVEVKEWRVQNVRKYFCANPYAKKEQVIQNCLQRGYPIPLKRDGAYEDNIADATAVAYCTQEQWKLDQLAGVGTRTRRRSRA